jgi:hypothetical protein
VIGPLVALGAGAGAVGGIAYGLFARLEARNPLWELAYERSLRRRDLRELDAEAALRSRTDVVVGLTTIPARMPYLAPTLKSLLLQSVLPERVVVHVPWRSRREGVEYQVPDELTGLRVVQVVRCDDFGPATKVLPTLLSADADRRIVAVDDDQIYRPSLIADLVAASDAHPDSAVGCCGLRVPVDRVDRRRGLLGRTVDGLRFGRGVSLRGSRLRHAMPVDILHGYGGYLVRPRFFDLAALGALDEATGAAWYEDDTWFAAHCTAPRLLVPCRPSHFPRFAHRSVFDGTRLGAINRGHADPEARNTTELMRAFSRRWTS